MSTVFLKASCFIMIILLGFGLKKVGILKAKDVQLFSSLVVKITLPAAIVYNFSQITMEPSMLAVILVGFLCSGLFMAVGYGLFLKGSGEQKAFGLINASGYNIGCFTMPFVQGFLGPVGVAATSLFDTGNAMICTGTSYAVGVSVAGKGSSKGFSQIVRQLFKSVPFDCYLIMTVLALAHLKLPELVLEFTKTVGNANTFLSLCMIGLGLELSMTKEQAGSVFKVVGARFFVSAVLSALLYRFAPFGDEIRRTLAILMFAPVSGLGVAYTSLMDGDVKLSCAVNSVSIIVGIVSLTGAIMIF